MGIGFSCGKLKTKSSLATRPITYMHDETGIYLVKIHSNLVM